MKRAGRFFTSYGRAIGEKPTQPVDYINGSMKASPSSGKSDAFLGAPAESTKISVAAKGVGSGLARRASAGGL